MPSCRPLEIIILLCFGCSWPNNNIITLKNKSLNHPPLRLCTIGSVGAVINRPLPFYISNKSIHKLPMQIRHKQ